MNWQVMFSRMTCCDRTYRNVGEVTAKNIGDALDRAQEEFGHLGEDDESLCVHFEPRPPTAWTLIAGPDLV
jgi:hypothetical protein